MSERIDIKNADVILSGAAARTTRLEVGTGVIDPTTRHPWVTAALGATMHSCYGERFILGRGDNGYFKGSGIEMASYEYMADYIEIVKRLWDGETVGRWGASSRCPSPRPITAPTRRSGSAASLSGRGRG